MKKFISLIVASIAVMPSLAQDTLSVWSMDKCMAYAAEHSNAVKEARWDLASASATRAEALADFFPSVSAQVGAQFNWGRNIDPETNTYNNVTTFNNGYGLYASLTIFDGGQTFNRYKRARVERERSRNAVDMQREDRAVATMMAYVDVVYYMNSIKIAKDKLEQSRGVLRLVTRQNELGIKSLPDVAQAQSTVADDEYNLVHQRNLYAQALLTLRSNMNVPGEVVFGVDSATRVIPAQTIDDIESIYAIALVTNPKALDAEMSVKSNRYAYRTAIGTLSPSISVNAGISTSYYKTLGTHGTPFRSQFSNNRGEYVSATLSIPIFSCLSRISTVRRAKYDLERSKNVRDEQLRKLHDEIASAVLDRNGYAMEIASLQAKVESDGLAYSLNRRKYEEGLMSLIDMQLSANTYYSSRVSLLQKQMLYILKNKLVEYYKGGELWTCK